MGRWKTDMLRLYKLSNLFDDFIFGSFGIAVVLIYNATVAITHKYKRYHLHSHSTFEIGIRVEQHLIRPSVLVDQRLNLVHVLRLINGNGVELHARLFLPVVVNLADSVQFAVAGVTSRGEKVNDKRFSVVRKRIRLHSFPFNCIKHYSRQLSKNLLCGAT